MGRGTDVGAFVSNPKKVFTLVSAMVSDDVGEDVGPFALSGFTMEAGFRRNE